MVRVLVVAALLTLAGCARPAGGDRPESPDLLGSWELVVGSSGGTPLSWPDGIRATLELDGEQLSGTSFCNHYATSYRVAGSRISIDALAGTQMACDPGVMAVETAFLAALGTVDRISRDGDGLLLSGPDVSLRFARQAPVPTRELAGTPWVLDTLVDGEVASSVLGAATLQLGADGTATGSTGCRGFTAAWHAADDVVSFASGTTEDVVCPPELAAQDAHVLAVHAASPRFEITGDRLTLTAPDGRALVYRAG